MTAPKILALDFDGVICDTVQELLKSTWQVYRQVWGASGDGPPPEVAATYVRLRPTLEIGWESPVLLRAIIEGVPEARLVQEFQTVWSQRILEAHRLNQTELAARFDAARDSWIRTDLQGWLAANHLYPGIADRLRAIVQSEVRVFVLTTKEGRFAHLLLEQNGVKLPTAHVWGKERARSKADFLRALREEQSVTFGDIWFIEDRLKTLQSIMQAADLETVALFLATWGYNTPAERKEARADGRIILLTLGQFCAEFAAWLRTVSTVPKGATR
ncbi:MAG: HAD family hydrolase [Candidatus Methylomirabilota bacterium]